MSSQRISHLAIHLFLVLAILISCGPQPALDLTSNPGTETPTETSTPDGAPITTIETATSTPETPTSTSTEIPTSTATEVPMSTPPNQAPTARNSTLHIQKETTGTLDLNSLVGDPDGDLLEISIMEQ